MRHGLMDLPSLERMQVIPSRPGEPAGDHLAQDEGGAHEHAPDEKEEGKGHRVEAKLLGRHDREVLQALVWKDDLLGCATSLPNSAFGHWSICRSTYQDEGIMYLVGPFVPNSVLEPALVQLVYPVVEELPVLGVGLQSPSCDDQEKTRYIEEQQNCSIA